MNELQRMKEAYKDLENKSAQVVMVYMYILVHTAEISTDNNTQSL